MTDSIATSLVRASAPYAFGLFLLSAALSAVRELVKPAEAVLRNALAIGFLALFGKFAMDNADTIEQVIEVLAGEKSLKIF